MKKRLLLICGILILVAVIALEATNAMNKGSTNTEEVISKPNKMAEPAQSTAESALPEPVLQGRKVNMDDAMWEDAINELDEYIDQNTKNPSWCNISCCVDTIVPAWYNN